MSKMAVLKTYLPFLFVFICLTPGWAQPGEPASENYLHDQVFRFQEGKKNWLKINVASLLTEVEKDRWGGRFSLAYEQKVFNNWSGQVQVERKYHVLRGRDPQFYADQGLTMMVGARYYYCQKRKLEKGTQGDNLSGTYFSASLGSRIYTPQNRVGTDWYSDNIGLTLMLGEQRYLYRYGFLDAGFGVEVAYDQGRQARFIYSYRVRPGWQAFPVAYLRFGLGI